MKYFRDYIAKASSLYEVEASQEISIKADLILGHDGTWPKVLSAWITNQDVQIYTYLIIASSVSFIIAMTSYHLFEIHFLRLKSVFC